MVYGSAYVELMGVWHNYGTIAPMTTPASVAPMVRKVERDCLSDGSAEIADAIEPKGILIDVKKIDPQSR